MAIQYEIRGPCEIRGEQVWWILLVMYRHLRNERLYQLIFYDVNCLSAHFRK